MRKKQFLGVLGLLLTGLTLGAAAIDWSKAEPVQRGVLLYRMAIESPRLMKVNLMRIDLRTPGCGSPGPDAIRIGGSRCRTIRRRRSVLGGSAPRTSCAERAQGEGGGRFRNGT